MRELRMSGSVRGVPSNGHPYRDPWLHSSKPDPGPSACFISRSACTQLRHSAMPNQPVLTALDEPIDGVQDQCGATAMRASRHCAGR